MTKYRKGDRVSVLGTITHDQDNDENVFIKIDGHHGDVWLDATTVAMVQPRFDEGDRVTWDNDAENGGTILSIQQGHAWIDMGGGQYCTRVVTSIERVEPQEPQS